MSAQFIDMENTAKNFALQLGSLISLYITIGSLISLVFGIITVQYPDLAQYPWEYTQATGNIRISIAMLIVFFPTYVILTRLVNTIRRKEHGVYLTLTKWLIYISLLIGGGILLGDLVYVLKSFLDGELTTRFILKALTFFIVVGAGFIYYLFDARGYWQSHERSSIQYGIGVSVVVLIALVTGFMNIETPAQVREMNIDQSQINDLTQIQSRIESYAQIENKLPATLTEAFEGLDIPTAPEGRTAYVYRVLDASRFELCADFAYTSNETDYPMYADNSYAGGTYIKNPFDWAHSAGTHCFTRVLTQSELPVQSNKVIP